MGIVSPTLHTPHEEAAQQALVTSLRKTRINRKTPTGTESLPDDAEELDITEAIGSQLQQQAKAAIELEAEREKLAADLKRNLDAMNAVIDAIHKMINEGRSDLFHKVAIALWAEDELIDENGKRIVP